MSTSSMSATQIATMGPQFPPRVTRLQRIQFLAPPVKFPSTHTPRGSSTHSLSIYTVRSMRPNRRAIAPNRNHNPHPSDDSIQRPWSSFPYKAGICRAGSFQNCHARHRHWSTKSAFLVLVLSVSSFRTSSSTPKHFCLLEADTKTVTTPKTNIFYG